MRRRPPVPVPTLPYAGVSAPAAPDLSVCDRCTSNLVEPTTWEAAGPERWTVSLRCPNCEHRTEGVFSQASVDRYDEALDDATGMMIADLKQLEAANLQDEIERFVGALDAGAILPEDFAR